MKTSKTVNATKSQLGTPTLHSSPMTKVVPDLLAKSSIAPPAIASNPTASTSLAKGTALSSKPGRNQADTAALPKTMPAVLKTVNRITDGSVENTTSVPDAKIKQYTIQTGLSDSQPAVVLVSEFVPIYGTQDDTLAEALQLKENARIATAQNAVDLLLQNDAMKSYVQQTKSDLMTFVEDETGFVQTLTRLLTALVARMNVHKYQTHEGNETYSFEKVLTDRGYSLDTQIENHASTKLWMQSLIETKRTLLTYSPSLTGDDTKSPDDAVIDSDPYRLSGVVSKPGSLRRIWLNPFLVDFPTSDDLSSNSNYADSASMEQTVSTIKDLQKYLYINYYSVNSVGTSNPYANPATQDASKDILDAYKRSGKDMSIIANCLFKEYSYSKALGSKDVTDKLSLYGYVPSTQSNNFHVWDHLIGRFPETILDFTSSPTGNGLSLVSLSQTLEKSPSTDEYYEVLTFENTYLDGLGQRTTPGSYFYVDSALNTPDGVNFDSSRLDKLSKKISDANETIRIIDTFTNPASPDHILDFSNQKFFNRFTHVVSLYRKCTTQISGKYSLDGQKLNALAGSGEANDRFISALLKTVVEPSNSYKTLAPNLKSTLFALLSYVAIKEVTMPPFSLAHKNAIGWNADPVVKLFASRIKLLAGLANVTVSQQELTDAHSRGLTYVEKMKVDHQVLPNSNIDLSSIPPPRTDFTLQEMLDYSLAHKEFLSLTWDDILRQMQEESQAAYQSAVALEILRQSSQNTAAASLVDNYNATADSYADSNESHLHTSIDIQKGVLRDVINCLKEIYTDPWLYDGSKTRYSGMDRSVVMYGVFDLALKTIADNTPEVLRGYYRTHMDSGPLSSPVTALWNTNRVGFTEEGFILQRSTSDDIASIGIDSALCYVNHVAERSKVKKDIDTFRKFVSSINSALKDLSTFLQQGFKSHLQKVTPLFTSNTELSDFQRQSLLNMSLSDDQLVLSDYIADELRDRMKETSDTYSKFKTLPQFSKFPPGFEDFMPMNDTSLITYTTLSSFFKNESFLPNKGNNKRIMSVGIPPRLIRRFTSTRKTLVGSETRNFMDGVMRLRLYKVDRLHPDIVYRPQEYLFETTRFPTRVIGNWDFDTLVGDVSDLTRIPTKVYRHSDTAGQSSFVLNRTFSDAFTDYGDFLTPDERFQVYTNHATSFLAEEYLRWFTDCDYDETRLYNYTQLNRSLRNAEVQYTNYLNTLSTSIRSRSSTTNSPTAVSAEFTYPLTGNTVTIPVVSTSQRTPNPTSSTDSITINMTNTLMSYFMQDTLSHALSEHQRRIVYPKKFDRVFNVVFDPDDFQVDETSSDSSSLDLMRRRAIIVKNDSPAGSRPSYRHRDTTPNDITLDEYFVTIEPYGFAKG